eukprot:Selendium_serpulae@DN4451_c0_g1_i2.p1
MDNFLKSPFGGVVSTPVISASDGTEQKPKPVYLGVGHYGKTVGSTTEDATFVVPMPSDSSISVHFGFAETRGAKSDAYYGSTVRVLPMDTKIAKQFNDSQKTKIDENRYVVLIGAHAMRAEDSTDTASKASEYGTPFIVRTIRPPVVTLPSDRIGLVNAADDALIIHLHESHFSGILKLRGETQLLRRASQTSSESTLSDSGTMVGISEFYSNFEGAYGLTVAFGKNVEKIDAVSRVSVDFCERKVAIVAKVVPTPKSFASSAEQQSRPGKRTSRVLASIGSHVLRSCGYFSERRRLEAPQRRRRRLRDEQVDAWKRQ